MRLQHNQLLSFIILLVFAFTVHAETVYVTDRILLGVHQAPSEQSPVITTVSSGTPLTVLMRTESFLKVRMQDGQEGYVSTKFIKTEKPASVDRTALQSQLQEEQAANERLTKDVARLERELQVHRDEASNAKTTIKELQESLKRNNSTDPNAAISAELAKTKVEMTTLQEKLAAMEKEKLSLQSAATQPDTTKRMQQLDEENQALKVRVEAALANLKGEKVPTTAELAAIRPKFPIWYWLVLVIMIALGAGVGIYAYDYLSRKRHGGFRL